MGRCLVVSVMIAGLCWGCQEVLPEAIDAGGGGLDVGLEGGDSGSADAAEEIEDAALDARVEPDVVEIDDAEADGAGDVVEGDVAELDADEPDLGDDVAEPEAVPSAQITAPRRGAVFRVGAPILFEGVVSGGVAPLEALRVSWFSSTQGELGLSTPDGAGRVSLSFGALTPGQHLISLRVESELFEPVQDVTQVGICEVEPALDFNSPLDPAVWEIYGDAFRDPGGWLEMTGLLMGRKGAMVNISRFINPGDVSIRFKIWTGGGTGADGFAMNIFNVREPSALRGLFDRAASGGGLGYGIYEPNHGVESFHIEFDTWDNRIVPNGDPFNDPTPENHVGVLLNADPGTHYLWAEIPTIEDSQWHDVAIDVQGSQVQVSLDGQAVIDGVIEGLRFKGGFIGFSGTTGYYTNFHRVDDLQILQECRVP